MRKLVFEIMDMLFVLSIDVTPKSTTICHADQICVAPAMTELGSNIAHRLSLTLACETYPSNTQHLLPVLP